MLNLFLLVLYCIIGAGLFYRYFLLVFGYHPKRKGDGRAAHNRCYAVAVPAHNEELVIGSTIECLLQMDDTSAQFDVHVVADHCSDTTAQVASAAGAVVHERTEGDRGRKGYALAWLFQRLLSDSKHYDSIVVFDADSRVAPDFLSQVSAVQTEGAQVVQGRHVISNSDVSVFSALADADMRLNNRIRNQAKQNLGLSARLMGDAMCFNREILESYPFQAQSLVEDREYGIHLVTQGLRVNYAPGAISSGQAVSRWSDATGQRLRWYGGAFDLQKRYVGPLLKAAWRKRSLSALDLAIEQLLPPFSTLSMLAAGLLALQVVLALLGIRSPLPVIISLTVLVFMFPVLGMLAERAPLHCYRALLFGPVYAAWRMWLGIVVRIRGGRIPWIRTRRAEEESPAP